MDRKGLLRTRLTEYAASGAYPFHMPGHKRNVEKASAMTGMGGFPDPFSIDITEIDGFDNLHHPEGILKESMEWAAGVYGADRTWYLVNGSSCGILSAVSAAVEPGGRILISRNCHKSVYHGVILNQLDISYIYPQILGDLGIQGGILAEDVDRALDRDPDIQAVLIVSPTYDGVVSDIRAIAQAAHRHGVPLLVDEAHGAHFPFGGEGGAFPRSALELGADLVIQSLHKTLPSLTQTAVMHGKEGLVDLDLVSQYLQIYQSSSPSYVFLAAIEQCIFEMEQKGRAELEAFARRLHRLRERLQGLKNLRLLGPERIGTAGIFALDRSKIVVSCRGCWSAGPWTGEELSGRLRRDYGLEMEMCGADYVTAITTFLDEDQALERLGDALLEIDGTMVRRVSGRERLGTDEGDGRNGTDEKDGTDGTAGMVPEGSEPLPVIITKPSDARRQPWEARRIEDCVGRISGEFVYLYPPGIPIVAPGELVTEEIAARVLDYRRQGLPVQGMADHTARTLRVLR